METSEFREEMNEGLPEGTKIFMALFDKATTNKRRVMLRDVAKVAREGELLTKEEYNDAINTINRYNSQKPLPFLSKGIGMGALWRRIARQNIIFHFDKNMNVAIETIPPIYRFFKSLGSVRVEDANHILDNIIDLFIASNYITSDEGDHIKNVFFDYCNNGSQGYENDAEFEKFLCLIAEERVVLTQLSGKMIIATPHATGEGEKKYNNALDVMRTKGYKFDTVEK